MKYFAVSYHLAEDEPLGKEGYSLLLLAPSFEESVIGQTIIRDGELVLRNLLIGAGLINRSEFMVPESKGIYESEKDSLAELTLQIANDYKGSKIQSEGHYTSMVLDPSNSERFHQDNTNLESIYAIINSVQA